MPARGYAVRVVSRMIHKSTVLVMLVHDATIPLGGIRGKT